MYIRVFTLIEAWGRTAHYISMTKLPITRTDISEEAACSILQIPQDLHARKFTNMGPLLLIKLTGALHHSSWEYKSPHPDSWITQAWMTSTRKFSGMSERLIRFISSSDYQEGRNDHIKTVPTGPRNFLSMCDWLIPGELLVPRRSCPSQLSCRG